MKVVSGLGATGKISSPPKGGTTVKILFPFGPPLGALEILPVDSRPETTFIASLEASRTQI